MDAMSKEIDRIAGTTTWAGANLMQDNSGTDFSFQVGAATGPQNQIKITIGSMNTVGLGLDGGATGVTEVLAVEAKLEQVAYTPSDANLSGATITAGELESTGVAGAGVDTDITLEDAAGNKTTVTLSGTNTDAQNAALLNAVDGIVAVANDDDSNAADGQGIDLTYEETAGQAAVAAVLRVSPLAAGSNISVEETSAGEDDASDNALASIILLDAAIKQVNVQRSELGAVSNQLNHTVNNLTNISSNLSAAKGGIEDADFALETTNLAKNQILQQASTATLAKANASKQNVLSLLQG
jgi:flagellin